MAALVSSNQINFGAGWSFHVQNRGTSTVTITPTTSTIDGTTKLVLRPGQGAYVKSDGTNYYTERAGFAIYSNTQTPQVAAVSHTTMVAVGTTAELFRFSGTVNCTTTSAAATATLNLKYTDTASTAQTVSVTDTCTSLATTGVPNIVAALRAKGGTNITYGVTIANTPTYDVDVRLEAF